MSSNSSPISSPTMFMLQDTYLTFKRFFNNNISSFDDLNDSIIHRFMNFCMNSLSDISYHSHKSLKCTYPNLQYYESYSREFFVYSDHTVTSYSITIPVFYCPSCNHFHSLLPAPFLIPHEQASIPFILSVLDDRFANKMKIDMTLDKYDLPQSTYYRWLEKYKMYYNVLIFMTLQKSDPTYLEG